jgi:hypothetical protein
MNLIVQSVVCGPHLCSKRTDGDRIVHHTLADYLLSAVTVVLSRKKVLAAKTGQFVPYVVN